MLHQKSKKVNKDVFFLVAAKNSVRPSEGMAEREGFEPSRNFRPYRFSRAAVSASHPPFQCLCSYEALE